MAMPLGSALYTLGFITLEQLNRILRNYLTKADGSGFAKQSDLNKYEEVYDEKKILLVDDNESSAKIISKMLDGTKIKLDRVSLGSECLDKIRNKEKYDLILLDEDMKPLDGITVMKKLQNIRSFNIKVLLLTHNNDYEYNDDYQKYGFSDYILKPIDKDKLLEKINKCLKWHLFFYYHFF